MKAAGRYVWHGGCHADLTTDYITRQRGLSGRISELYNLTRKKGGGMDPGGKKAHVSCSACLARHVAFASFFPMGGALSSHCHPPPSPRIGQSVIVIVMMIRRDKTSQHRRSNCNQAVAYIGR